MYTEDLTVPPPVIKDWKFNEYILCGPGPNNYWPNVAESMARPVIWPIGDDYYQAIVDVKVGIQYIFQTKSSYVLAMSGSGHAGMETVISNVVAPGETLLIATRGIWDERAFIIAKRYGIKPIAHNAPLGSTFDIEELEKVIKKVRPVALFITHGDSSTGSVQKLDGLGDICHKYGVLLLVDTVVSIAAEPFFMDKWGVDGVYTSTQKALSGPAGISPVAFSELAQRKIKNRKHEPPFYFDMELLVDQWDEKKRAYHHTLSPPLMWALRCCLQEVIKMTLPGAWQRHMTVTKHFHDRLAQLPVTFLVTKPEDRLLTVTTLLLPPGYDIEQIRKFMREKYNIVIFGGLGPTTGKALRIGIMGVNSTIKVADAVADGLTEALRTLKKSNL